MSEQGEPLYQPIPGPDIISWAGMLLAIFLVLFILYSALFEGSRISAQQVTPLVVTQQRTEVPALVTVAPTTEPTPTGTATATALPTATVLPTSTLPPTSTPLPTATPLPPTAVAEPLPRQAHPTLLPTSTPTPLPTPIAGDYTERVPILMYHYVDHPPPGADKFRRDLSVAPEDLRWQLQYLRDHGYTTIDLYDLARILANQQPAPPKPVILTFDDGYRDNYENAFPLLREFGMKAVFFVITDLVDQQYDAYMTWPMVAEMAAAGMSMEIHTRTHPSLSGLDPQKQLEEILGAQEMLAYHTGRAPRFLSYPGGRYDEATLAIVRELDLWGAVTTRHGREHTFAGRYELARVRVRQTTNRALFYDLLEGND